MSTVCHSCGQFVNQRVHQFLLLGAGGPNAKLLAGLLELRHRHLSQGAFLDARSQLIFG